MERITYHAHSAPLHKIKTDNMLPSQLLTAFQACCKPLLTQSKSALLQHLWSFHFCPMHYSQSQDVCNGMCVAYSMHCRPAYHFAGPDDAASVVAFLVLSLAC